MQKDKLNDLVMKISGPARGLLDKMGYGYRSPLDEYIRGCLGIRSETEEPLQKGWFAAWMTAAAAGLLFGILLAAAGMQVEAAYITALMAGTPGLLLYRQKKAVLGRRREISDAMPRVINLIIILVDAGLPMSGAIRYAAADRFGGDRVQKILAGTVQSLDSGISPTLAWKRFASECMTPEASALASLVLRESSTGVRGISESLRALSSAAEQTRRRETVKAGETAKTELLIPQTMIFGAILLLSGYPALQSIGGML